MRACTHRLRLFVFLGWIIAATAVIAEETRPFPPFTFGNTELRPIPRSMHGRDYLLYIALPASYGQDPAKKYPVVYLCDGYWSFALANALYSPLVYDKVIPEFIIVGLGYAGENPDYGKMRMWELSPLPLSPDNDSGHASKFLESLEKEILPLIEREYQADPHHRVLAGGSLGGLFSLYAMLTKPELFRGYIAISPAATVGDGWLGGYASAFAKSGKPLDARLFMSIGGNESPHFIAAVETLNEQIAQHRYPKLAYHFRRIDGERHAGTSAEAMNRGLRFVFQPFAPETGPKRD